MELGQHIKMGAAILEVTDIAAGRIEVKCLSDQTFSSVEHIKLVKGGFDYQPHLMGAVTAALSFLSEHDGIDYLAIPVDTTEEAKKLQQRLAATGVKLIAKIDHEDGLENINGILDASNAIQIVSSNLQLDMTH